MPKEQNSQLTNNNNVGVVDKEENRGKTGWTANAKWIVGLLLLIVVLLSVLILTNYVKDGDNLLKMLVNFSTILSIFLSISSIAFAGYTSIETGRQFHFMSRAVEEIRVTNNIMSENYKNLLNHYHDTVSSFSKLLENSRSYNNKMNEVHTNVTNSEIASSQTKTEVQYNQGVTNES